MSLTRPTIALGGAFELPEAQATTAAGAADTSDYRAQRRAFRVGDIQLMLPESELAELLDELSVFPLPNAPEWTSGLLNLRGELLPVINLHHVFDVPADKSAQRLLAVGRGTDTVVLTIDDLPFSVEPDTARNLSSPPDMPAPLIGHTPAVYEANGLYLYEFNHQGFLSELRGNQA